MILKYGIISPIWEGREEGRIIFKKIWHHIIILVMRNVDLLKSFLDKARAFVSFFKMKFLNLII